MAAAGARQASSAAPRVDLFSCILCFPKGSSGRWFHGFLQPAASGLLSFGSPHQQSLQLLGVECCDQNDCMAPADASYIEVDIAVMQPATRIEVPSAGAVSAAAPTILSSPAMEACIGRVAKTGGNVPRLCSPGGELLFETDVTFMGKNAWPMCQKVFPSIAAKLQGTGAAAAMEGGGPLPESSLEDLLIVSGQLSLQQHWLRRAWRPSTLEQEEEEQQDGQGHSGASQQVSAENTLMREGEGEDGGEEGEGEEGLDMAGGIITVDGEEAESEELNVRAMLQRRWEDSEHSHSHGHHHHPSEHSLSGSHEGGGDEEADEERGMEEAVAKTILGAVAAPSSAAASSSSAAAIDAEGWITARRQKK